MSAEVIYCFNLTKLTSKQQLYIVSKKSICSAAEKVSYQKKHEWLERSKTKAGLLCDKSPSRCAANNFNRGQPELP